MGDTSLYALRELAFRKKRVVADGITYPSSWNFLRTAPSSSPNSRRRLTDERSNGFIGDEELYLELQILTALLIRAYLAFMPEEV